MSEIFPDNLSHELLGLLIISERELDLLENQTGKSNLVNREIKTNSISKITQLIET